MDDSLLPYLSYLNNSFTNAANVYMASQTDDEDRAFSERMTREAWQHNIDLWNMQNEYNLPVNQYARQLEGLRVNGLNPNLVYGGSSAIGGAASAPSPMSFQGYHSTAVPRFNDSDPFQSILSTRLLQTQVAAQEANNRLINARADNEEARHPGISAKSQEAAHRWDYISNNIMDNYDEAVRSTVALQYWKGVQSQYEAEYLEDKRTLSHYEAAMAEFLNTEEAPGTGLTYRQYMEACKAYLPGAQYERFKADVLDIASRIAYRAEQGQLLRLKEEFQTYVNRLAKYGRSLGNNWVSMLISGLQEIWPTLKPEKMPVLFPEKPKDAYERGMAEHPAHNY